MFHPFQIWIDKFSIRSIFPVNRPVSEVLVVSLFLMCPLAIQAQNQASDTISIIDKLLNKTDTLVHNPEILRPGGKWSQFPDKPSDSLTMNRNNNLFNRELYNLLLKLYANQTDRKKNQVFIGNLAAYDGKFIRKIEIKKVNVFAGNTLDTSYVPSNWLQKAGTTIHTGTRDRIIERNLLLKPRDQLDVFLAAENERLLRDMPYIMDARFLVRPIPGEPDSVDLVLFTRDLWPVGFSADLSSANSGFAGLWYYNIFGYGHQLLAATFWDGDHTPLFGYRLLYGIPSFNGSFISSELEYIDRWNTRTDRIRIARDFKTVGFKNAGAMEIENSDLKRDVILQDTTLSDLSWKYTNYEFWFGRILPLKKPDPAGISSGLFLAGRVFHNQNHRGPQTEDYLYYAYQDKTQLFFSGGFTHRGFRKDNLIYSFDRTEDVPFGYLVGFTSGVEWGQYKTRTYIAASYSIGSYLKRTGYLFGQAEYGTFIYGNSLEQGTLRILIKAISKLHTWERFQYRNFATLTYLNGINRYQDEFTSLENRGGILGLTSPSLRGNEKLALNLESVVFSPYHLLGFRFAFFGSVDLGLIKTENQRLSEFTPFSGISLGVRIRNDQLVFDTFELKFSVYPGKPADAHPANIKAGSVPRLKSNELFPNKPGMVEFN